MPPSQDALLDINEAAKILGISPWTLRNWVRDRQIEFIRMGRRIFFRRSAMYAKIAQGTVPEGGVAA